MTHVTSRLTAKNRDQLRNPTLSNRVWATSVCCRQLVQSVLSDVDQVRLESQSESRQLAESTSEGENRKARQYVSRGKIAACCYDGFTFLVPMGVRT